MLPELDGVRFSGIDRRGMLVGLGSAGVRSGRPGRLDCEWRAQEPTVSACLGLRREEVASNACPSCWDCVGRNKAIDGPLELVEQISYPGI